jgi:adenylate kinase family enzyme
MRSEDMKRVVIIGRGASGKSTLAVGLGQVLGLPVIELDRLFWQPGLVPTSRDQWAAVQEKLVKEEVEAIATHAASADLHVLRSPGALRRFVAHVARAR